MPPRIRALQTILLLLVSAISYIALILPEWLSPTSTTLQAGDVSPNDYQAPRTLQYESKIHTEEARLAAQNAVAPVYAAPNPTIARQQIERLRVALQFITLVREDENSTRLEKEVDIAAFSEVTLQPETITQILLLSSVRWKAVQEESLDVLEQVMRRSIREEDVETVRRSVPPLVSLSMNEREANIVAELVTAFVAPNSVYNAELTEAARRSAREAVAPIIVEFKTGQIIVLRGETATPAQLEALEQSRLIRADNARQGYAGAGALVLGIAAYIRLYFSRRRMQFLFDARSLTVIALIFVLFIVSARLSIPDRTVVPYAFPLPAMGLLIATLFGVEVGIVFSVAISILGPYGLPNTLDLLPYYLVSSLIGVLVLGAARRVWTFFRAGIAIAISGVVVLVAFRIPFTPLRLPRWLMNGVLRVAQRTLIRPLLSEDGFAVGDRVMILKRGENVGDRFVKNTDEHEVLEIIVSGTRESALTAEQALAREAA